MLVSSQENTFDCGLFSAVNTHHVLHNFPEDVSPYTIQTLPSASACALLKKVMPVGACLLRLRTLQRVMGFEHLTSSVMQFRLAMHADTAARYPGAWGPDSYTPQNAGLRRDDFRRLALRDWLDMVRCELNFALLEPCAVICGLLPD